jgi:Transcriptional regulator
MHTRGVGAVSFRSVAAEAGVSAGRVQHYFPNKEDLIHSSFDHLISQSAKRHADLTAGSAVEAELNNMLTQPFADNGTSRQGVAVYYSYVALSVTDHHIAAVLGDARRGARRDVERLLTTMGAEPSAVETKAVTLQALSEGLTLGVFQGDLPLESAREVLRSAVHSAVADR